ncbi:helix-turn-helix domain-containing protein [Pseudarthrobacter sp. H2]|uniref:helix-turn-helix domain-containing protein n=1 Tax=Pseudarthrobacter sp. H2 TaxID=3418415 RepID=UPI003CF03125
MQNIVQEAIRHSGYSRSELARRAGVSTSTVTRIEKGASDPTLGMVTRILAAAGLQLPAATEPLCDPEALRAARSIIGGVTATAPDHSGMAGTLMRWASPDGSPQPRKLAREAGAAAPPRFRPGVTQATSDWNFLRICSTVSATRKGWAVSGAPAATRIGATEVPGGPIILYVEEPRRVATLINRPGAAAADIIVLPFDGHSEAGAWNDEGVIWADPIQIILDCYGMAETAAQAVELTKDWEPVND